MKNIIILIALTASIGLVASCSDSNNAESPPEITFMNPTVGATGTPVTISGSGFSSNIAENTVSFNGTPTTVSAATPNELQTTVPEGATTGAISVTVNGQTAQGPAFSVDNRLNFEGDYENKDYEMVLSPAPAGNNSDTTITVTTASEIEIKLVDGSMDEIELDVEEFLEDGLNFVLTALSSSPVFLSVDEDVIAEVSGNAFEFDDIEITVSSGNISLPGELSGEGVLQENGTILFSLEYFVISDGIEFTFSGEVELEKQ